MEASSIGESQWILCLIQITLMLAAGWLIGRITLRQFPDISASVGVVAMLVSAGLIGLTWAQVPRPFQLTLQAEESRSAPVATPVDASTDPLERTTDSQQQQSPPLWLGSFKSLLKWTAVSTDSSPAEQGESYWTKPISIATVLLLTLLGGVAGVFRVVLSLITVRRLMRSSTPVNDAKVRAEVKRIVTLLPIGREREHQDIPVRQFKGMGSPFVCCLAGRTIFVPESFLTWSDSEQSISLGHEIGHLQRRDHYCRLITQLTFCLTWLHPFAWILHRQTVFAQELAADQVAAQTMHNSSAYCRGLSRLALRFDAECGSSSVLGVSVSSSLIRRITMLKGITHRLPRSLFVNRCLTLTAFVACSWIGCWSVSAQSPTQEEQADSKVVAASHTTPVTMFSRPATAPWEVLESQSGYFEVEFGRVLNHPYVNLAYRPTVKELLSSILRFDSKEVSYEQFGLSLDEITQLRGGISVHSKYDPQGEDGQRSSIGMNVGGKVQVTTANPVDWPGLIKALDFEEYGELIVAAYPKLAAVDAEIDMKEVEEYLLGSAEKSRTHIIDSQMFAKQRANKDQEGPTETKKSVWESVSGGALTVVYDIDQSGEVPEEYQEQDSLNQAHLEMTIATEIAAWGVDMSEDYRTFQVRFAAVPEKGVSTDDLVEKFRAFKAAVAEHCDDDEFTQSLLEQFNNAKVTVVEGELRNGETTKAYMLVEGECTIDFFKLVNSKQK